MAEESSAPPAAATKRGMGSGMAALLVIIFMALGFVAGAFIGPRIGLGGNPPPAQLTTIVVGTNTPFPPFEYRDPTSNALQGLDIDLMNEIGERNKWEVVWRDFQDWDALLAAIEFQGVDIGASSITSSGSVGAQRNDSFDFSNWYYEADQAVLVQTASTAVQCAAAECTPTELANHTVAVQTLTSSYWWVQGELVDTAMTPASMVTDFGDLNSVIQELINGNVDWVLVDKPIAERFVADNANLRIEGTIETNELYAFAVADGDPSGLVSKINSALTAMKADGTFNQIMDKWLG